MDNGNQRPQLTGSSNRTDWTRYHELDKQFEQAMARVEEGARKINEGLNRLPAK